LPFLTLFQRASLPVRQNRRSFLFPADVLLLIYKVHSSSLMKTHSLALMAMESLDGINLFFPGLQERPKEAP